MFEKFSVGFSCKKESKTNDAETTKSIWSNRLKQFEFNETTVEKRNFEDDDDLKIDINDLVWCSSKRKKVTL